MDGIESRKVKEATGAREIWEAEKLRSAMHTLKQAIIEDPGYAWGWHSNIAMAAFDEGLSHEKANKAAARFMKLAFDVDMTKNEFYKY